MPPLPSFKGLSTYVAQPKPTLRFRAAFNDYTGYGLHACSIADHFIRAGYGLEALPLSLPETSNRKWVGKRLVTDHIVADTSQRPGVNELVLSFVDTPVTSKNWLFTMYETTRMSPASLDNVNKAKRVIVPSKWCQQNFSAQGVKVPIDVIPIGIDLETFRPGGAHPELTVFGTAGNVLLSGVSRKNIDLVLRAFQEEFRHEDDVRLRIKVQPGCPVMVTDDPRVDVIREVMTDAELADWYRSLAAYVSPSRAEAFGRMNLEALACGVPVISCLHGGVTEYLDTDVGYAVGYTLVEPVGCYNDLGLWAEPDFKSLMNQMRSVYENRERNSEKGEVAADWVTCYAQGEVNMQLEMLLKETGFWDRVEEPVKNRSDMFTFRYFCENISGFGQQNNLLALEFCQRGLHFTVVPTSTEEIVCDLPPEVTARIGSSVEGETVLTSATLYSLPEAIPDKHNVLWTTWETTRLKKEWVDQLNRYNAIYVPCKWNVDSFKASGVTLPVYAVSEIVESVYFSSLVPYPEDTFVFLAGGDPYHGDKRKGIDTVLRCFSEEFKEEKDVRMHVKLAPNRPIPQGCDSRLRFNNSYLTTEEMRNWYDEGHVFVSGAAAEGWGLMQTQALARGRRLIGARYAGQEEYMNDNTTYYVDYTVGKASGEFYDGLGDWAIIDENSLKLKMREAYTDYLKCTFSAKQQLCRSSVKAYTADRYTDEMLKALKLNAREQLTEKAVHSAVKLNRCKALRVKGPLAPFSGYGQYLTALIRSISKTGVDVCAVSTQGDVHAADCLKPYLHKHESDNLLVVHPPDYLALHRDIENAVALTMWESTRLRPEWVEHINSYRAVIVPCAFNANCFSAQGVNVPIHIVPLGIDISVRPYYTRKQDDIFVFGAAGALYAGFDRKRLKDAITYFKKAFPTEQDVRLKLRVSHGADSSYQDSDWRITIVTNNVSDSEMSDWYSDLNCFITTSTCEGWGLHQHESMLAGCPVIASCYGGITEFFDEHVGFPIPFNLVPATGYYKGNGLWSVPVAEAFIEKMRYVYTHKAEVALRGEAAHQRAKKYSIEHSAESLLNVLSIYFK